MRGTCKTGLLVAVFLVAVVALPAAAPAKGHAKPRTAEFELRYLGWAEYSATWTANLGGGCTYSDSETTKVAWQDIWGHKGTAGSEAISLPLRGAIPFDTGEKTPATVPGTPMTSYKMTGDGPGCDPAANFTCTSSDVKPYSSTPSAAFASPADGGKELQISAQATNDSFGVHNVTGPDACTAAGTDYLVFSPLNNLRNLHIADYFTLTAKFPLAKIRAAKVGDVIYPTTSPKDLSPTPLPGTCDIGVISDCTQKLTWGRSSPTPTFDLERIK